MPTFEKFWKWLQRRNKIIPTLAGRKKFEIHTNERGGKIVTSKKRGHKFTICDAHLTWARFHGLKQAMLYFCEKSNCESKKTDKPPHLMTSSYALPNNKKRPLLQNWQDSPNGICCPYIAGAMKAFFNIPAICVMLLPMIGFSQSFVTNGLVAYYSLSSNANDASGNGNNGTPQNVNFVSDRYGSAQGALTCSNASSCIIVADSPSLEINNHLTMSAWINVATNQAGGGVAIKGVVGNFSNFGLSVFRSGTNLTFTYDKTSGIAGPTAPALSNGRWQQIVVAISEPDSTLKFYVNGQLVTSPTVTYAGSFNTNIFSDLIYASEFGNLYLGNNNSDGLAGGSFDGAIDDVRIYNRTLSDSEVQQLYQVESAPSINLVKAVTVSFGNLSIGTNYQLQVTTDITSWTNFGTPITATNSFMTYSNYWNISDWNQLFFRLQ